MSDGTVQRYDLVGHDEYCSMQPMAEGDYMLYDDHKAIADALHTQARELADIIITMKERGIVEMDEAYRIAQAVLKEVKP